MRGAHGDWYDALCEDLIDRDGVACYALALENGDRLTIPVEDIGEVLETKKVYRAGDCAVIPFGKRARRA